MNIFKKLFGKAAEGVGEIEDLVHHPIYPTGDYTSEVVKDILYRGSWPNDKKIAQLKAKGIDRFINLCSERQQANAFQIPIEDNTAPSGADVERFVGLMRSLRALGHCVYVHCEQGKGRTGCMVAAYRVRLQGWSPSDALAEAKKFGLCLPVQVEFIKRLRGTL